MPKTQWLTRQPARTPGITTAAMTLTESSSALRRPSMSPLPIRSAKTGMAFAISAPGMKSTKSAGMVRVADSRIRSHAWTAPVTARGSASRCFWVSARALASESAAASVVGERGAHRPRFDLGL